MSQVDQNVFMEWVDRYRDHPTLFVQEVLGVDPDPWQKDFLEAIAAGNRKVTAKSGHGVGKSTGSSWAMLWFFMQLLFRCVWTSGLNGDMIFNLSLCMI